MSNQRYDVLAVRKYKDRQGGEKSSFTNVGVAFANRDGKGFSVSLHCVPVPEMTEKGPEIRLLLREPKPLEGQGGGGYGGGGGGRQQTAPSGGSYEGGGSFDGEDIPFLPVFNRGEV